MLTGDGSGKLSIDLSPGATFKEEVRFCKSSQDVPRIFRRGLSPLAFQEVIVSEPFLRSKLRAPPGAHLGRSRFSSPINGKSDERQTAD